MLKLEDLLACCIDEQERTSLQSKLTEKELRFNQLMEKAKDAKYRCVWHVPGEAASEVSVRRAGFLLSFCG
ncbi:hypothetical protein GCM10020331_014910 [Ectobacillus funiculus]